MAKKKQQTNRKEAGLEVPLDYRAGTPFRERLRNGNPVTAGAKSQPEPETPPQHKDTSPKPTVSTQRTPDEQAMGRGEPPSLSIRLKRFSSIQKILAVSIMLVTAVLVYELAKVLSAPVRSASSSSAQNPSLSGQLTKDAAQKVRQPTQEAQPTLSTTESLSLKTAEHWCLQRDYDKAYSVYDGLCQRLPADNEGEVLRDFLQLKMALCMKRTGDTEQAEHLFRAVVQSRSPVVRILASYYLSSFGIQKKQYLKARARAYQAIALIEAIGQNADWVLSLEHDCHFLIAESITKEVLSLCDIDRDLPAGLWSRCSEIDPFTNLDEAELRRLLNSGVEQLSKGLLGPKIQSSGPQEAAPGWSITCYGAPIEELLARFASNANLDIHWFCGGSPAPHELSGSENQPLSEATVPRPASGPPSIGARQAPTSTLRQRAVSLYMSEATPQQFVTVAAGCARLSAHLDDEGAVNVFDLSNYSSLSEHVALLGREAIWLWRRFLLKASSDQRQACAHFALGLLQAQSSQPTEAIAEYRLVANRFSHPSLSPLALLHSSKLKSSLRDHLGAREDLRQIIEQFPNSEFCDQARLRLANATMQAKLYDEAARLYRNAYNLGFSGELQTAAALGAGRSFYQAKDYNAATKWLTEYINLAKVKTTQDLCSAYLLLGKTALALGKPKQACDAFKYALTGPLFRDRYVETVSALVKAHMQQGQCMEALNVLENVHSWKFSQEESVAMLLLKVSILRSMGLVDKAIAVLGEKAKYLTDSRLKAKISFELAKCALAKGDLARVRKNLSELLALVEPGLLAQQVQYELAGVCLKVDQTPQTISLCLQLLDSAASEQLKQETLKLLATAYRKDKNYDKAALALLGQWGENVNANATLGNAATKSPTRSEDIERTGQLTQ